MSRFNNNSRFAPKPNNADFIEEKQIKQLILVDFKLIYLKNNKQRLKQAINNKFRVQVKDIIRSSLSSTTMFINFFTSKDCRICYENRYTLEKGIYLKLPKKPLFSEDSNENLFTFEISNPQIKNRILLYNEIREFLPEGIRNLEPLDKRSGKYKLAFKDLRIYLNFKKFLEKNTEIKLSNGVSITFTDLNKKKPKGKKDLEKIDKTLINNKGRKLSEQKKRKVKHFKYNEKDTRSMVVFDILKNIKILNADKKIKYRVIKKSKPKPSRIMMYLDAGKDIRGQKRHLRSMIKSNIIPVNQNKVKRRFKNEIIKHDLDKENWATGL
ncbi:unnamed protein product [Hanseniaspora opuntiae]